jgi:hypothetical protein
MGTESDRNDTPSTFDATPPAFPVTVRLAGIIWIGIGSLIIISSFIRIVLQIMNGEKGVSAIGIGPALIAAAFLYVGILTVTGKSPGILGNAIGAIVIALAQYGIAVLFIFGEAIASAVVLFFVATTLLFSGVLAILGKSAYADWRRYQKDHGDRYRDLD